MTATTRIEARQLLPGRGDPLTDGVVVLEGDTISYAGPKEGAPDTPGAALTRCDTVMPGMWDCHTHLIGVPHMDLTLPVTSSQHQIAIRAANDAARVLRMGFTSLREVGGHGVHVERIRREGDQPLPRVYSSNGILSTTGGHGDLHEIPLDLVEAYGDAGGILQLADGVPEVLKAVRRQLRQNAKLIKVCASGGVLSEVDDPIHQQFSGEELRAIVEEAGRADRIVAAHCHGAPGIEAAIEAGVHTIEHGSYLNEEHAAAMKERGMVLVPTRTIVDVIVRLPEPPPGVSEHSWQKGKALAARHLEAMQMAIEAGVIVAAGTDLGLSDPAHPLALGRNAKELEFLVAAGMTPLQAIEAATATGPMTLGPQAPMSGQLVAGYDADVLTLSADPLADITVLQSPASIDGVWLAGDRVVASRDGVPTLRQAALPS